jgi:uncharacterized protein YdeI (YjbR/CyaY-like superfamily)
MDGSVGDDRVRSDGADAVTERRAEIEPLELADVEAWDAWLAAHHDRSDEVWLRIARKGSPRALISIGDALDVALCYGWIDSQRRAADAESYLQRYSPRRPASPWSRINMERVEALTEAGRMRGPGLAQVEAAKADGRWAVADAPQREAIVPPDPTAELNRNDRARVAFERLDKSGRSAIALPLLKTSANVRARRHRRTIAELESKA